MAIFIVFAVAAGCGLSDATWAIKKYIEGDRFSEDPASVRERVFRAKLGADLLMGLCIILGFMALFGGVFILLANYC